VLETPDTPTERAGRYLRMADHIRQLAWTTEEVQTKHACLDLAMEWTFLARVARRRPANDA
jgi:hypothetical protein